jgi:hypothetical protein
MIPGISAELPPHLEDHRAGRAGDRVDRQAGEQEDHRRADDQPDQVARVGDVEDAEVLVVRGGPGQVEVALRRPRP